LHDEIQVTASGKLNCLEHAQTAACSCLARRRAGTVREIHADARRLTTIQAK
jgi:hypothetical protein